MSLSLESIISIFHSPHDCWEFGHVRNGTDTTSLLNELYQNVKIDRTRETHFLKFLQTRT